MKWIDLTNSAQLAEIKAASLNRPQVIFKHSTRCSISVMAKSRLDRSSDIPEMDFYYLDLLSYRSVSQEIAELFQVHHESPQVLLIQQGECTYDESHNAILIDDILEQAGLN